MRFLRGFAALAAIGAMFALQPAQADPIPVDLELQLLVDDSGSVSASEFALQRDGYVAAFRDSGIIDAIENGDIGAIAVQLIYWASSGQQQIAVDWFLITDSVSANAFADLVAATTEPYSGSTAPGSAINFGVSQFNNDYDGTRQVIDVSGDGAQNNGADTATARDAALAAGIDSINGLPILTDDANLDDWYLANIVGGANGFLVVAENFDDFAQAVITKIGYEISGEIPLPGAIPLMVTGLALLWGRTRRRKQQA